MCLEILNEIYLNIDIFKYKSEISEILFKILNEKLLFIFDTAHCQI